MDNTARHKRRVRFVLLGEDEMLQALLGRERALVCRDESALLGAIGSAGSDTLWISSDTARTEALVRSMSTFVVRHSGRHRTFRDLLLFEPAPRNRILPVLHGWFDRIAGEVPGYTLLPKDQLGTVLAWPCDVRHDVFAGGIVDRESGTMALTRGDLDTITVPLSLFRPSGRAVPDFTSLVLDDYGRTLRFGDYEAASDGILYELDADYRRRINARRRSEAKGFGPSLRRLRSQRGLSREDFPGLSAKTIARIERGEIEKPRGRTLTILARRLGVAADEIESY